MLQEDLQEISCCWEVIIWAALVSHSDTGFSFYYSFAINRTPNVPGPQWLEITPPARVSRIS